MRKQAKTAATRYENAIDTDVLTAPEINVTTNKAPVKHENARVMIKPINFANGYLDIEGLEPYLQNKFSSDNREKMMVKQKEGSAASKTRKAKPPKDFERVYRSSMHISREGWHGIPASGIRQAMIDACRLTEMDMVRAKMCIFVVADGLDRDDLEPLVKINGKPQMLISRVRIGVNQTDLAARAMFEKWSARVQLCWDADVFSVTDVANLLARAGRQVGIGAGRPLSKSSAGTGRGTFIVKPT